MDFQSISETARSLWVVWLMIVFLGIIWWVFRPKNKERFEDAGRIPFRDEENGG